ncbi:unnamed protein product [Litomosoides sigmodontis]|uniref:RNA helicase n=1 Tax=Litomosoides sigmodontis TaxID=42156 RepID=A0A3P6TRT9_LITSI|nr:unnamed protein product [Litomosoides sigmodontis]
MQHPGNIRLRNHPPIRNKSNPTHSGNTHNSSRKSIPPPLPCKFIPSHRRHMSLRFKPVFCTENKIRYMMCSQFQNRFDQMPKIISGNGVWKTIDVPGECITDGNFAFLATLEEYVPIEESKDTSVTMKKTKKKKAEKRKASFALDKSETNGDGIRKNKKNKKKKFKKSNDFMDIHQASIVNSEKEDGDAEKTTCFSNNGIECEELDGTAHEIAGVSNWINLSVSDTVFKAIADMGFVEPTEIQKLVIPVAIRDRVDIIGAAETGSGKTLAFGVPVVEHLLTNHLSSESEEKRGIRALILAPTRELGVYSKL